MKMLRHCYLLVVLFFAASLGSARAQSFVWAKVARGAIDSSAVQIQANTTDATGHTYVAVQFRDSLRVGNQRLTTIGSRSVGLVKYDSTGVVLWAKLLRNITIYSMAADNTTGEVFLTAAIGTTSGQWNGTTLALPTGTVFYGKYAAASTLLWTQAVPLYSYSNLGPRVVADAAGSAYIMGAVPNATTFNGLSLLQGQALLLKSNGAGALQWTRVLHMTGTSAYLYTASLGPKPGGGCLVHGTLIGQLYLGGTTGTLLLNGRTQTDAFATNFDANGNHLWSMVVGNVSGTTQTNSFLSATAADSNGNCYLAGHASQLPLGSQTLNGSFLLKYDAAGVLQWARSTTASNGGTSVLAVSNLGPTVVFATNTQPGVPPAMAGALPLRARYNFVHYNPQGLEQWVAGESTVTASTYFQPFGLGLDARGNLYPVGLPSFPRFVAGTAPVPAIVLGAHTTVGNGAIVSRITAHANTLRGLVYLDQNGNGLQDAGELPFPRMVSTLLAQSSGTAFTPINSNGELQAYAEPGAYSLGLTSLPANYTLSQPTTGSYTGTFTGYSQLVSGQNFGIVPIANQADIRVTLTPYAQPRPGFTTRYRLTVENVGTTTTPGGTATLVLDNHFAYISSTPSASRTGQTLTWNYASLSPFGVLDYDILLSLPTNAVLGTALSSTVTAPLTGDVTPDNNTSTLAQTVVGSYDPNSIEVSHERITPTQVAAQQWLEYTIHFQNMGTASAINVILSDTLDYQKLNPATLQWITQSHNCIWSLTSLGPNTGLLTVRFLGINLPERNVDVIRSQGFVRFRVRARPTLSLGAVIPNDAGIVFDYNVPVLTNVATTTVFLATATLGRHTAPAWDAYPNPATDAVTVSAELATAGLVRVELLDVLGRPVRQQVIPAPAGPLRQTLNLRGLAPGVYVLRLTPPTGPATSRQVVHE